MQTNAVTIYMQKDQMAFIPGGHLLHVSYYRSLDKKKKPAETEMEIGTMWLVPFPLRSSVSAMSSSAKKALKSWNHQVLNEKTFQMWKDRLAFVDQVLAGDD